MLTRLAGNGLLFRIGFVATLVVLAGTAQTRRALIAAHVDETKLYQLSGNTRPEVTSANDLGAVEDSLPLEHMMLQLQRSSEQESALNTYLDQLHNPQSANYHKWLTASEFGNTYGASAEDIATVTNWLTAHGFTVHSVSAGNMVIDFSGTAAQVRDAFHTEMHYVNSGGQTRVANVSDPKIPAALAPAVRGLVSLHNFAPRAMKRVHKNYTFTSSGSTYQAVTPADLATIYNLTPAFALGYTGSGQTIAVIEDTNLYSASDWTNFRSRFGLSQYTTGNLTTVHPSGSGGTCTNPGVVTDYVEEATLDAEWASASAPGATIEVASCADTRTTFGGYIALVNLINSSTPPNIISISYGECEAENGASTNAAYAAAYQQAVAEGISVFVAAGDEGAAGCDASSSSSSQSGATHGIGVSAFASTPYNVAVGGTDFGDSYAGTNSQYWNSTNTTYYGSAISYIPEIPWNDSCAGSLITSYLGYSTPYGSSGFCASSVALEYGLVEVVAGSGGPSGCATGTPSTTGVVSGTCAGYAKPSWQSGLTGNPSDGVRDLPDVSLFSGSGLWGHYYPFCYSDTRNGGASCTSTAPSSWPGAGGTSFAAPIMAGIQALVNQKTGTSQGNPNYAYYQLAAAGTGWCSSNDGDTSTSSCIFHNVTTGDITVNCSGSVGCYGATTSSSSSGGRFGGPGGGFGGPGGFGGSSSSSYNGALSTSTKSFAAAYGTSTGWNFSTGIGSVNVLNLLNNWPTGQ